MSRAELIKQYLKTGTYGGDAEKLQWTYYDTLTLDSTKERQEMFVIAQGRSISDTNIIEGGVIPTGQLFEIMEVKPLFQATALLTEAVLLEVQDWIYNNRMKFFITGKDSVGEWPLAEMMGQAFAHVMEAAVLGNKAPINPDFDAVYQMNIPIRLAERTSYKVIIEGAAPTANLNGFKLKVCLGGILTRLN